ncbi:MAG: restriction endonuclease [Solirubrobacteraceae bacterium]
MRHYDNFSDHDFELFVADLLGAEDGRRYETFPRGRDQGVDLRWKRRRARRPHVVQCKHFVRSSYAVLRRAARKEARRLTDLEADFASYRFVTSQPLTARQKTQLAADLAPSIACDADVLGAHDLEGLLDRHPDVERRQAKLWLTGGTQLGALLHAGTLQRSQSLIADIERSLPRYVQGDAFTDARKQLRDRRVLAVAGVPGIGKTTLARILLADAVLDGYEPIEISYHVEEGWELLDDSVKQIFLYDDFLGRTALAERFAKNEDRRLLDFMDRAARHKTTLFVLTTREYILRQAGNLYERLDQAGVGQRRYLLELPSYSRVDRARIFANHAYHSPTLSARAKRSLLNADAYELIIDHANYNPRIIEWITGLGGRELTTADQADYAAFAIDALDHPEVIWRHAFEQEIDDYARTLVLVLASMGRATPIERVEAAFDALCEQRGLATTGRAFQRTLAALDDSLVSTRHASGDWIDLAGLLVGTHDPSVADFAGDYLRASPADAQQLAHGAQHFEQATWLWALHDDHPPARLIAPLTDALMRTYDAPAIRPVVVSLSHHSWSHRPDGTIDREARLLDIHRLARNAGGERERLMAWLTEAVTGRYEAWRAGEGEPESLLKLLEVLRDTPAVDADEAARAPVAVMRSGWAYVQNVSWQADLRTTFPGAYTREQWTAVVDEYAAFMTGSGLETLADELTDIGDLREAEALAGRLGITLGEDELAPLEERVRERSDERERAAEEDEEWEPERSSPSSAQRQAREVEAIFERLADNAR